MHHEVLDGMMRHVPSINVRFDGNCAQANGINLPIVVINLPHRSDRWQTLSQRMSAVGLTKLIRAPAVEGARLSDSQITALLSVPASGIDAAPRSHLTLTRPAIGCFLSHLAIWRWVIKNEVPRVLVFEDDAAPAPHFDPARLRSVLAANPQEAGMVLLGLIIMNGLADRPAGSDVARIYYFNGTFAYLITPATCRSLIQYLLPLRWHIDHQISKVLFEQRHVFPAYYTEPRFFEADWTLQSDCYVPLAEETDADRELERLLEMRRHHLLDEGRPLLSPN
jgi:GR25 family glycosyltransferase involved in LPS biosynthesis